MSKENLLNLREGTNLVHCTNCTDKDNNLLPDKYQRKLGVTVSLDEETGVILCPRCKCPEVMIENKNYEPTYGFTNGGKI